MRSTCILATRLFLSRLLAIVILATNLQHQPCQYTTETTTIYSSLFPICILILVATLLFRPRKFLSTEYYIGRCKLSARPFGFTRHASHARTNHQPFRKPGASSQLCLRQTASRRPRRRQGNGPSWTRVASKMAHLQHMLLNGPPALFMVRIKSLGWFMSSPV
jgi:hypothetical protein